MKCPPAFLQAVMEAGGVTVVCRVYVAPHVIVLVVVVYPILRRVLVGVGSVVVWVKTPEKMVAGGRVEVLV